MTRIAISEAAFAAIVKTMPVGPSATRTQSTRRASAWSGSTGRSSIAWARSVGAGESYSDVILRLAQGDGDLICKSPLSWPR